MSTLGEVLADDWLATDVFFEKLRIKENKPKTQFRLEMESIHPKGMNVTDQIDGGWVTMHKDERMVQDKYGRIDFVRVR